MTRIAWGGDIHLDHAGPAALETFFESVRKTDADMLVLCGDISGGYTLANWLDRLELELNLPVRFVLGNHDFYGSSFERTHKITRKAVAQSATIHDDVKVLSWLSDDVVEILSDDAALVGHEGWYDARAGILGRVIMNDFRYIEDLKTPFFTSATLLHDTIREIADREAAYFDGILRKAFALRRRVVLVTHVPPFPDAAWHEGHHSHEEYLPYFCSVCAGNAMVKVMEEHQDKELLVLCGHTHGEGEAQILPNLKVLTAKATYGLPSLQGVIEV